MKNIYLLSIYFTSILDLFSFWKKKELWKDNAKKKPPYYLINYCYKYIHVIMPSIYDVIVKFN